MSESPRTAARFAAAVLGFGGVGGLLSDHLVMHQAGVNDVLAVANVVVAFVVWFLPWDRWPSRATLVLAALGLVAIGISRAQGSDPPATFVSSFVMVFMWLGLTQPPGTSFVAAGPAAATYVIATIAAPHHASTELGSLGIVLPVLLLSAEVPARMVAELRRAQAIEHQQALGWAKEAETDALTGLGNRRFGERLIATMAAGDAALLIDIDHFKSVNDRFGHAGGDRLLREVGGYLTAALREGDGVARIGGEEFLVLIRQPTGDARDVGERLLAGWRALHPVATFSVGVSVHDGRRSGQATCQQADTALYRAKRHGRNQVWVFGEPRARRPAPAVEPASAPVVLDVADPSPNG